MSRRALLYFTYNLSLYSSVPVPLRSISWDRQFWEREEACIFSSKLLKLSALKEERRLDFYPVSQLTKRNIELTEKYTPLPYIDWKKYFCIQ